MHDPRWSINDTLYIFQNFFPSLAIIVNTSLMIFSGHLIEGAYLVVWKSPKNNVLIVYFYQFRRFELGCVFVRAWEVPWGIPPVSSNMPPPFKIKTRKVLFLWYENLNKILVVTFWWMLVLKFCLRTQNEWKC